MNKSIDIFEHPLLNPKKQRFLTPPVEELRSNLMTQLWTGATGACILGKSRFGKTTALKLLEHSLSSRAGRPIPVIRYSAHRRDKTTVLALVENLCGLLDLPTKRSEKAGTLVKRAVMRLAEICHEAESNILVFFVDEVQRLSILQIDVISEILDTLDEEFDIHLASFFIGNSEEMGRLIDHVTSGEHEHIEGRFFQRVFEFHGLRNISEVAKCLSQYDNQRFPENGPTYVEFVLPQAVEKGFRVEQLAPSIWSVFERYRKDYGINEWGMDYFTRAVSALLTDYLPHHGVEKYTPDMFIECITISDLVPDLVRKVKL